MPKLASSLPSSVTRDGKLDASFGTDGFSPPYDCTLGAVATVCDGKIVIAGELIHPFPAADEYCAVVLTADGQLIEGAPATGMFTWPEGAAGMDTSVLDTAIEPVTGRLVFIHGRTGGVYIIRINLP